MTLPRVKDKESEAVMQWIITTSVADMILAKQDGRAVEVEVGPLGRKSWAEPAPVEIIEGRKMRFRGQ